MKKKNKYVIRQLCMVAGIGLFVAAVITMILWQWEIRSSEKKANTYVQTLRSLIPEPQGAVPEERSDNAMPVLSVDNTDFVGILEMPRYGSALPVGADWGNITQYLCCFSGSVYDGTMQIGGTSQKGQFDFYREISVGDALYFTDMEGNRFAYEVTDVRYEKHADQSALQRRDADLKLFVKNVYAFEYIIIFCDIMR